MTTGKEVIESLKTEIVGHFLFSLFLEILHKHHSLHGCHCKGIVWTRWQVDSKQVKVEDIANTMSQKEECKIQSTKDLQRKIIN